MSAIIASKECRDCGDEFYISFGSPNWWKNVVLKNQSPCAIYKMYNDIRMSGMCPLCWILQKIENEVDKVSDEHISFMAIILDLQDESEMLL